MYQTFETTASPATGPARLAALQAQCAAHEVDGFVVPRADAHQGEYVAPRDDRLAWLTGFTGSAGWCIALRDRAAIFTDSRYTLQVVEQTDAVFEKVDWPATSLANWLSTAQPKGRLAFDPWLLSVAQHRQLRKDVPDLALVPTANLVDAIWPDQPAPPMGKVSAQPLDLTGESAVDKITRLAAGMTTARAAVLTLPDSIAWLLNIRGTDIPRNPVPHGFAVLHADATVDLFIAAEKLSELDPALPDCVRLHPPQDFLPALAALDGAVTIDPDSCPVAVADALTTPRDGADPCILPKARKTRAELAGARAAHLRDGAAMVRFLAWLDDQVWGEEATDGHALTEIDIVRRLEEERRATNALRDISFETIAGSGPHGAIVHYRVTHATNRPLSGDALLLLDSGGQYRDGTTDITRTICIGGMRPEHIDRYTRVLRGMIALSRLRFPKGLRGRDIDAFARAALWEVGLDYGHGTGHGVGSYLSVHEGPQRLARTGSVVLEPGMILSNEPGFYQEGGFGIRIENLIAVREALAVPGQTVPEMLCFETLTLAPIDTRLVAPAMLTEVERDWLNAYHVRVLRELGPQLDAPARRWLAEACAPI